MNIDHIEKLPRVLRSLATALVLTLMFASLSVAAKPAKDDVAAVRNSVDSYVEAINRRDVEKASQHWDADAVYVLGDSNTRLEGREAIAKALGGLLNSTDDITLQLADQSFRQIARDVVVEQGMARVVIGDRHEETARYEAIHVKKQNRWYRSSVREAIVASPSQVNRLSELNWLIGRWQRAGNTASVDVYAKWTLNKRFITRGFAIHTASGYELRGTQTIGWDPSAGVIRSWTFDSDGGYEQAVWSRDEDRWLVRVSAVLPDGSTGSEQRILMPAGDDQFTQEVVERQINGQLVPSAEKVTLTRKATKKD